MSVSVLDVEIVADSSLLRSRESNNITLYDPASTSTTYLVGLCTGLLPAAALASSKSITQLLELAPEIACISLRLGLEASRRSAQIEDSHESWATLLSRVSLQEQREVLRQFHDTHVRRFCCMLCLSRVS